MRKVLIILISITLLLILNSSILFANEGDSSGGQSQSSDSGGTGDSGSGDTGTEDSGGTGQEEEPPRDCLPEAGFEKYSYAEPEAFFPNLEEETTLYWNFQCTHDTKIEITESGSNTVLYTIDENRHFQKGDNDFTWNGQINGDYLPNGIYDVVITPLDEFSIYPAVFTVTVYNFKYTSLIDIFGEEFLEKMREELIGEGK